jgi:RNA polymerase sigma-70 factor (ECF subfamily)
LAIDTLPAETYTSFVRDSEPRLRQALVARFGPDRGREATAEALAYGWEHWERIAQMQNPAGYLYRVGQSRGRRRWRPLRLPPSPHHSEPLVEPALPGALARLSGQQRTAVILVHGFAWTHNEVADLMGVSVSTLRNHLRRGMNKLRDTIGGET